MISEYTIKARLAPTSIAAPPILLMFNALFGQNLNSWLTSDLMILFFGKGTAIAAIVFLMMQINRIIGIELFQNLISKDELDFPTTRWLLHSNSEMSVLQRNNIDRKLRLDFKTGLLPPSMGDSKEVRRHNADLVGRIRIFVGSPPKLLQHNIEYGFFRNLIGSSVPVIIVCAINSYLYSFDLMPQLSYNISLIYAISGGILICFSKFIIQRLGIYYARVLFHIYLATEKPVPTHK